MQNVKLSLAHVRATSISRLHIQFDRYVTIRKSTPYLLKNNGVDNQFDCYKTKIRSKGVIMNNYGNPPPLHSFDLFFLLFFPHFLWCGVFVFMSDKLKDKDLIILFWIY